MNESNNSAVESPLLSEQEWIQHEVIDHLRQQLKSQMASLTDAEQLRYRALFRHYADSLSAVEREDKKIKDEFEAAGIKTLKEHLLEATGKEIDPLHTYLHTRYLQTPEERSKRDVLSPATGTEKHFPASLPILDEREPRVHVVSMNLWQAACLNFGWLAYWESFRSDSLVNASYINDQPRAQEHVTTQSASLIEVKKFIDVVRKLDLGTTLSNVIGHAMSGQSPLASSLGHHIKVHVQFALLEYYRTSGGNAALKDRIRSLAETLEKTPSSLVIKKVIMTFEFTGAELMTGSGFYPLRGNVLASPAAPEWEVNAHHISLPLFQIEERGRTGVFSFFPGRPNGELRLHRSEGQLIEDFKTQYFQAHADKKLDWFDQQLTPEAHKKLTGLFHIDKPPGDLNVVAQWLYDTTQQLLTRRDINDALFKTLRTGLSLEENLQAYRTEHYHSRLKQLAVTRSEQDWEDIVVAVMTFFQEITGLLLTPVPGALKGLNRIVRYVLIGVTSQGLIKGLEQVSKGEGAELLQTLTDVLDILISAPLHTSLGKIARSRHLKVLSHLGNPRKFTRSDGTSGLWHPDPAHYVGAPAGLIDRLILDESGIYHYEGRDYVLLEKDGQQYGLEVIRQAGSHQLVLRPASPSAFRPPIAYDSTRRCWQLLLDDSRALSNEQLLSRMVPGLSVNKAQTLLNISSVSRASLDAIWAGGVAPAALSDAVSRFQADTLIERISAGLNHYSEKPLPLEPPALALLTQIDSWPSNTALRVLGPPDILNAVYGKVEFTHLIDLHRLDDGQLILDPTSMFKAFPADFLPEMIKLLSRRGLLGDAVGLESSSLSQRMAMQLYQDRNALFESLTIHKGSLRSDRLVPGPSENVYLPIVRMQDVNDGVIKTLRQAHPDLSRARCMELLRVYPILQRTPLGELSSTGGHTQASDPIQRARFSTRLENLLDAAYHPRRFNLDTDRWVCEISKVFIRSEFNLELVIHDVMSSTEGHLPYTSADNSVMLFHFGKGEYAGYDAQARVLMPKVAGADSFYAALLAGLLSLPRVKSRLDAALQTVAGLRKALVDKIVEHRTPDGYLDLPLSRLEDYEDMAFRWSSAMRPYRSGHYRAGTTHYIVLEGRAYQVQLGRFGYAANVVHPDMFARAPLPVCGNGEGAWRHKDERPLTWDGQQLFRRLGYTARDFNADQIAAILNISGTPENVLRRMHVYSEKPPPLLADTMQRFTNYQRLEVLLAKKATLESRVFMSEIVEVFERHEQEGLGRAMSPAEQVLLKVLLGTDKSPRIVLPHYPDTDSYVQFVYHALITAKADITPSLFEMICRVTEHRSNPCVALLQRAFTSLPAQVADDLISHATVAEIRQMTEHRRIPLRLAQEARWYVRELRLNRAFEGFYWPALHNNDSVKLLLHAFVKQPGWPDGCQIEMGDGSAMGQQITQSGVQTANLRLNVIKTDSGWEVFRIVGEALPVSTGRGDDVFSLVLAALPEPQRQALGYHYAGGDMLLKEQITLKTLGNRNAAYAVLGMAPQRSWFCVPKRLADGRRGYELSGRGAADSPLVRDSLLERYATLYPGQRGRQSTIAINAMRRRGQNVGTELNRLEAEFNQLERDLESWVTRSFEASPYDFQGDVLKRRIAGRLVKAWRKESPQVSDETGRVLGHRLELDGLRTSTLPVLNIAFSHISSLSMVGMGLGDDSHINEFLRSFTLLTSLDLEGSSLVTFPAAIGQMSRLTHLSLLRNAIPLSSSALDALATLTELRSLNLSGCRLLQPLNVSGMPQLRTLNLANTDIMAWPRGVAGLTRLTSMDLRNNSIMRVPDAVFEHPVAVNRVTHLAGNDFSAASRLRLQGYQERTGIDFGLHLEAAHPAPGQADSRIWLGGLEPAEQAVAQSEWDALKAEPSSEPFFELLEQLRTTADFEKANDHLVSRVRAMLTAAARSETLRSSLFYLARGRGNCCDSVALIFSHLETEVLVAEAHTLADAEQVAFNLAKLRRGLFRLHEVDRLAINDAQARAQHSEGVDEVEIILGYRLALTVALDLPGQPKNMRFPTLGRVAESVIKQAESSILAMNSSDELLDFMAKESFWVDFLEAHHTERFAAIHAQRAEIDFEAMESASNENYDATVSNFEAWRRERKALISSLTREVLDRLDV